MLNLDFLNSPSKDVVNYQYEDKTSTSEASQSNSFNVFQEYTDLKYWTAENTLSNNSQMEFSDSNNQSFSQPLPERQLPLSEIINFQNFANVCQPSQASNDANNYFRMSENVDLNLK